MQLYLLQLPVHSENIQVTSEIAAFLQPNIVSVFSGVEKSEGITWVVPAKIMW